MNCGQSTQPDGPANASYSLYASKTELQTAFDGLATVFTEMVNCPGETVAPSDWFYKSAPDVPAGRVACGYFEGNPDIQWSEFDNLVLADVQSADLNALHNWWLNYS